MKVFSASFTLVGEEQTEILDITKHVREAIQRSPISNGIALINTLHTTCALLINEWEDGALEDFRARMLHLVPDDVYYGAQTCRARDNFPVSGRGGGRKDSRAPETASRGLGGESAGAPAARDPGLGGLHAEGQAGRRAAH